MKSILYYSKKIHKNEGSVKDASRLKFIPNYWRIFIQNHTRIFCLILRRFLTNIYTD